MTDALRAEYSLLTDVPTAFSPAGETAERSDGAPVQLLCSTELLADAAGSRFVSFFGHLHRPRGQHPSIVARAMPPRKKPRKQPVGGTSNASQDAAERPVRSADQAEWLISLHCRSDSEFGTVHGDSTVPYCGIGETRTAQPRETGQSPSPVHF